MVAGQGRGGRANVPQRVLPRPGSQTPYWLEVENLSDAIKGEAQLLLGREDAMGQARALAALHQSAESGEPVTIR
jgi:predicted dehydrogenase